MRDDSDPTADDDRGAAPAAAGGSRSRVLESAGPISLPEGAPRRISHYRFIRLLGRGGMGQVFLAHDETLDRLVAVKVLPIGQGTSEDLLRRFLREGDAIASLSHPSIVSVFEVGAEAGFRYLAMHYVAGQSLKDFAARALLVENDDPAGREHGGEASRRRTATWRQAFGLIRTTARQREVGISISVKGLSRVLRVVEQTARALDHAHSQGVIHRDVKPSNIMVDAQGMGHLLDFGLAKLESDEVMTRTGEILGTVAYMAPEQISNRFEGVDGRTDVWGLGVTLFECICGRRPFEGGSPEAVIYQTVTRPAPSPAKFTPEISRDIETIVLKCLEKPKSRRYQTAGELADDIARVRAHQRIEAEPVGRFGRALRWAEHHRALAAIAATLVLALAAVPANRAWRAFDGARRRTRAAAEAMARARDLDERHAALRLELKARRDACASFERAAEPWHAPDDPRKARWFAAREALATAESEARTLADRTLFAHEEAVESAVLAGDAGSARRARDEFLLARLIESEIDRDADEVRRMTLALEDSPLAAKVKGSGRLTLATFPAGAEVTIHRCEEAADGRLLARGGEPLARATSPIEAMALSAGSYVARITCSGRQTLLYPFLIERDEHWGDPQWHGGRFAEKDWRVELPATADYDGARFVFVPAGPYQATADPDEDGLSPRLEWRWEDGFLIQRFEATMRDYRDFVEAPETYRAMARAFQIQGMRGRFLPRLSSQEPMESLPEGESVEAPVRVSSITVDTDAEQIRVVEADLDVAMHGTSQAEIVEFCSWLSIRSGWTYSLPTASQWQKAARGVDGRSFPWGNRFDWSFLRVDPSAAQSADRPGIGGKTPADESPYGLFDMAGNAREWCSDGPNLPEAFVNPWLAGGDSSPLSSSPRAFVTWPLDYFAFSNLSGNWGFRMTRSLRRTR